MPRWRRLSGEIGIWGYSVETGQMLPPTTKDYLTYCEPNWVSDYGWNLVLPTIRELTSWDG